MYVLSPIEHKSRVDYNVAMQILRYMMGIWHEYEKDMRNLGKDSRPKGFRYPPVLPIVYYEGKAKQAEQKAVTQTLPEPECFQRDSNENGNAGMQSDGGRGCDSC